MPAVRRSVLAFAVPLLAATLVAACSSDDGSSSPSRATEEPTTEVSVEPDRTLQVTATDFAYEGLDLSGLASGDVVRIEMVNEGEQAHELEILDPDGEALGEVEATDPGATGTATITLGAAGEHSYQCILTDPATGDEHVMLGMGGTFTVAE